MNINLVKSVLAVGFILSVVNVHAAPSPSDGGVQKRLYGQITLPAQSHDMAIRGRDGQDRYAGGTGVGNPGTSGIVQPGPQGPVRDPRRHNPVDGLLYS